MLWKVEGAVGTPTRRKESLGKGLSLDEAHEIEAQARDEKLPDGRLRYSFVDVKPDTSDWHANLDIGERVRYTVDFVRNVFGVATNEPRVHSIATVLNVQDSIATVEWDCGGVDRINVANLGRLRTTRTCAC
jgi:hypothetical protein